MSTVHHRLRRRTSSRRWRRLRAGFEQLEQRRLLATVTVNTTADVSDAADLSSIAALTAAPGPDGAVSLREAIIAANNTTNSGAPDRIEFAIPAIDPRHFYYANDEFDGVTASFAGTTVQATDEAISDLDPDWPHSWYSIQTDAALPAIVDTLVIDGYTQPGAQTNTLTVDSGLDTVLRIEMRGRLAGVAGLTIQGSAADNSAIRGLAVNHFQAAGIQMIDVDRNRLQGVFLGLDVSGTIGSAQSTGAYFVNSDDNLIGGPAPQDRNLVSGNLAGLHLAGAGARNRVAGNLMGTDISGTTGIGNANYGVLINGPDDTIIGGSEANVRNVFAASSRGIQINGTDSLATVIQGNYIGTDVTGSLRLGNVRGIQDGGKNTRIGRVASASGEQAAESARNLISANTTGIAVTTDSGTAQYSIIQGNFIGTDTAGSRALGNDYGIQVFRSGQAAASIQIGGTDTALANVISGNLHGIGIQDGNPGSVLVQGNWIGIAADGASPLGNTGHGIWISGGAANQLIGGSQAVVGVCEASCNVIAHNGQSGIRIESDASIGNAVLGNSIFANGGLGIDLVRVNDADRSAANANDPGDVDAGPNNLQNQPVLTNVRSSANATTVDAFLTSATGSRFRVEFFTNAAADGSGFGEGQTFVGAVETVTDAAGVARFSATLPPNVSSIAATATRLLDHDGDPQTSAVPIETSEFSAVLGQPLPIMAPAGFQIERLAGLESPHALAYPPAGSVFGESLFVATLPLGPFQRTDTANDLIARVADDGVVSLLASLVDAAPVVKGEADPHAIEFAPSASGFGDFLYVSANRRDGVTSIQDCGGVIQRVDAAGNINDFTSLDPTASCDQRTALGDPLGLAFGPGGDDFGSELYVANGAASPGDIVTVGTDGSAQPFVDDGSTNPTTSLGPSSIEWGPGGDYGADLYFTDDGGGCGCIRTVNHMKQVSDPFANTPGRAEDLEFGPGGAFGDQLYVAVNEDDGASIYRVSPGGELTRFLTGLKWLGADSLQFNPAGDRLYIADRDADAVYALSPLASQPPTADAGGPYLVDEGMLALDAGGSSDPDSPVGSLTYEWDLDYDGQVFKSGVSGRLASVPMGDNFDARPIALRVTDPTGLSDIAETTLEVRNVAPTLFSNGNRLIEATVDPLADVTLSGSFLDPGSLDTHTIVIDWGDGDSTTVFSEPGSRTLDIRHGYPLNFDSQPVEYTIDVTVTDDDGGAGSATVVASVAEVSPGSIEGRVHSSTASQGLVGLNDWTVELVDAVTGVVTASQSSFSRDVDQDGRLERDEGGFYKFENVPAGTFLVRQVPEPGWAPQSPEVHRAFVDLVSVAADGSQTNLASLNPALSSDGRFVAFESDADNLVADDTNGQRDIFVYDRLGGEIARISVDAAGNQANAASHGPSISGDGRFVAFASVASNLVRDDTNALSDIFVYDRETGDVERINLDEGRNQADRASYAPAISADGRVVAFHSAATNLVPGDTNNASDIFVFDRGRRSLELASRHRARIAMLTTLGEVHTEDGHGYSYDASLSADGRFVAFESTASDLVPGDDNGATDVFVYDRAQNEMTLASISTSSKQGNAASFDPVITADGRFVGYVSSATNLVDADNNDQTDIFVFDRLTESTRRVSVNDAGEEADGPSDSVAISGDGRWVAFVSSAGNLITPGYNNRRLVFVHDLLAGRTTRASSNLAGFPANSGTAGAPALSADGRYVAFDSAAPALVPDDDNGQIDVFVRSTWPGQMVFVGPGAEETEETEVDFINQFLWATVVGVKYADLNGDGYRDDDEPRLPGWRIYGDVNGNRQRDRGEPVATTDDEGFYRLLVPPGDYAVREEPANGWSQTKPGIKLESISTTLQGISDIQIEGDRIAWIQGNTVFSYDESGTVTLGDDALRNLGLAAGRVAWQSRDFELVIDGEAVHKMPLEGFMKTQFEPDLTAWIEVGVQPCEQLGGAQCAPMLVLSLRVHDGSDVWTLVIGENDLEQFRNDEGRVAWEMHDGNDWEIFLYESGQVRQLTDNDWDDRAPEMDRGNVVWMGSDGLDQEIYVYSERRVTKLTDNQSDDFDPLIEDGRIAWLRAGVGRESVILNGETLYTADAGQAISDLQMDGNHLLWRIGQDGQKQIFVYDGSTVTAVTPFQPGQLAPQLDDGRVAWQTFKSGSNSDLLLYDMGRTYVVAGDRRIDSFQLADGQLAFSEKNQQGSESELIRVAANQEYEVRASAGQLLAGRDFGNFTELPNLAVFLGASRASTQVGEPLSFRADVVNLGIQGVIALLKANVPDGATLMSATVGSTSCLVENDEITCPLGEIDRDNPASAVIVVLPRVEGDLTLDLTVLGEKDDANPSDNSASLTMTIIPAQAELVVESNAPAAVLVGQPIHYTLTVTNEGRLPAESTKLTYVVPDDVQLTSATVGTDVCVVAQMDTVLCSLQTLPPDAEQFVAITVQPNSPGRIEGEFKVSSPDDPGSPGNEARSVTSVYPQAIDLFVELVDAVDPYLVGNALTLSATVGNQGYITAADVSFSMPLPAGVEFSHGFMAGAPLCDVAAAVAYCDVGRLGPGEEREIFLIVTPSQVGDVTHVGSVSSGETELDESNNSSSQTTTIELPANFGAVEGYVIADHVLDGRRGAGDEGLANWIVYADQNRNRQRDNIEPFAITGSDGRYNLLVPPGDYIIRREPANEWRLTEPGITTITLSENPNQESANIDNGRVVWTEYDGDLEVFLYDPVLGTVQLTDNESDDAHPQIDGEDIVWFSFEGDSAVIKLFDGNQTKTIASIPVNEDTRYTIRPKLNGGRVVWLERDQESKVGSVMMYADNQTMTLWSGYCVGRPEIDEIHVAWTGLESSDCFSMDYSVDIFLSDGQQIEIVGEGKRWLSSIKVDNGQLAWWDEPERGIIQLKFYDGQGVVEIDEQPTQHNPYYTGGAHVSLDDGQIAWSDERLWGISVYAFGELRQITETESPSHPEIDRGQIVWLDGPVVDHDLFLFDGNATVQVSNHVESDLFFHRDVKLDRGRIVWTEHDYTNHGQNADFPPRRLMLATLIQEYQVNVEAGAVATGYDFVHAPTDDDLDGVSDLLEDGVADGDGNNDGIRDREQRHVASLPTATTGDYVTIVAPDKAALVNVRATDNPSLQPLPKGVDAPLGFLEFSINGLQPAEAVAVDLIVPKGVQVDQYFKYGVDDASADPPQRKFYQFNFDGTTGATWQDLNGDGTDDIRLHFVDGGRGDDDLLANGIVVDPGGPVAGVYSWQNVSEPLDVNGDGLVSAIDVLIVINRLNALGAETLPPLIADPPAFYDTNGDGLVSALDVLGIINHLNGVGQGESERRPSKHSV